MDDKSYRIYSIDNFPIGGDFEYYEFIARITTPEIEDNINRGFKGNWTCELSEERDILREKAFRLLYGNEVDRINPFGCDNITLEKTDIGYLIIWYDAADSGGYDVTKWFKIMNISDADERFNELKQFLE